MSEIIDNSRQRVNRLKELLSDLHKGKSIDATRQKLAELMGSVPYGEVVQAEQELITEGLPAEEIQKYCDIHSQALKDVINVSHAKKIDPGHPVHTFKEENSNLKVLINKLKNRLTELSDSNINEVPENIIDEILIMFNNFMDIDKHFQRKENLVFPFLEKYKVTGPPKVMWGKDDEIRSFLKSSISALKAEKKITKEELTGYIDILFIPTIRAIEEMIYKEEQILFPMCMDTLTEIDWYEIYRQSDEIGYCLFSPSNEWEPATVKKPEYEQKDKNKIQLPTGSFTRNELESILNTLPFDLTFVDKDDKVKYFSSGKERIFQRNKAIIGRLVQYCHPPSSVHIVEQILNDFKSGKQDNARFWINFQGKYILIAYYAVRNEKGEYQGTLEVTQDISDIKKIEGERRLLTYDK